MGIFNRHHERTDASPDEPSERILELNPAEVAWMEDLRRALPAGAAGDVAVLGRLFDESLDAWEAMPAGERPDPNLVINAIGVAAGDMVLARVPTARWLAVSDEGGHELAVVAGPAHPDSPRIVPLHAVGRRWSEGAREWLPGYVDAAATRLVELTAAP